MKRLSTYSLGAGVAAALVYGYSLSRGWNLVVVMSLVLMFVSFRTYLVFPFKRQAITVLAVHFALMLAASWWFRNIEALGWADIAGVSPKVWLMLAVSVAILLCSLSVVGLFWLFYHKLAKPETDSHPALTVYHWAIFMTLAEVIKSWVFALIAKGEGMPIEPFWNLYSAGLALSEGPFAVLSRGLGFWGVSFLVYFFAACLGYIVLNKKVLKASSSVGIPLLLFVVIAAIASSISFGGSNTKDFHLVGLAQQDGQPYYLKDLPAKLPPENNLPVLAALPEYGNLLHPFTNTAGFSFSYDARYELPDKLNDNVYLTGTEDEIYDGKRYAESYVVNNKLEKIKRSVKTFLIPGGEYTPSWTKAVLSVLDKSSVDSFLSSRGRQVINQELKPETNDTLAKYIGIGACSILLTPYKYQAAVSQGALVLTSNVSFEQFSEAPEYQHYAGRFARFISISLKRPLVIGAREGAAEIFDESGKVLDSSLDTASARVSAKDVRTVYGILGDRVILLFLLAPAIITKIDWKRHRKVK